MTMAVNIVTIKSRYKDEWVLIDVLEEDELNRPVRGKVIAHSKNRDDIYDKIRKLPKGFKVATIFTGKIPPDMAFAF